MSEKSSEEVIDLKHSPIEEEHSRSRKRLHPFSVERILQDNDQPYRKSVTSFSAQPEGKKSEMKV